MIEDNQRTGGFTLIEMMIVIAIIGILSSVVLIALGPSRDKAKDARIISDMNQIMSTMETLYNPNTGKYPDSSAATANPAVSAAVTDIGNSGGQGFAMYPPSTGDIWYLAIAMLNDKTNYYCVDSSGNTLTIGDASKVSAALTRQACK